MVQGVSADSVSAESQEPIYIGILLPLTGPDGLPLYEALQLGTDQINSGGGIGGRPIRLVFRDTRTGNLQKYAHYLATDPRIHVVIGPYTSEELFQISDLFVRAQKVLVSPSASSDEIFRAFAGTGNVWRLRTNDRDLTSVVTQHLIAHGVQSVAVLSPNNTYGETFSDWIPFWAMETGLNLTGNLKYSGSDEIPAALKTLDQQDPEYIIFVYSGSNKDVLSALKVLEAGESSSHLYLIQPSINENGYIQEKSSTETLLGALVSGQWKLSNTSTISVPLPDDTLILMPPSPDSGFSQEYFEFSGREPSYFVSEVYDALLVSAQIMARFSAYPNQSPMKAANTILLNGTGKETPRTGSGIQSALTMILNNEIPVMIGATGPLTFVSEGTDRKEPWFQTYQIVDGSVSEDPIAYTTMSKQQLNPDTTKEASGTIIEPGNASGTGDFWAVIGGLSQDWNNYRHQADALTMYQILREQGVPDDHIILLVYDDIPYDPRNVKPGEVYHTPHLEEVRQTADPDYSGTQVSKEMIENILSGGGSPDLPVLDSNENSTVLMYVASHGVEGGLLIVGDGREVITPGEFSSMVWKMKEQKRFGRMLVILESCFSGAMGDQVATPGVLVLTAAGMNETSKSAIYDSSLSSWISDEFTSKISSLIRNSGETDTVRKFYEEAYRAVRSSHPGIYNYNNSFSLNTPVSVFFGGQG